MTESDRDPRPDLREDHILWASVLILAYNVAKNQDAKQSNGSIFGLLHGLRCGGARLNKLDNGGLKLDYEPLLATNGGAWDKDLLVNNWLMPFRKEMAAVFRRAAA